MGTAARPSWRLTHAPPRVPLEPFAPAEVTTLLRGGEVEADVCERVLAWAARAQGALDVAIAEGLHALRQGDRLAALGCHLDDYAREVLDLGRRAALGLARLGRELATRPLLREALRSGRVRLRAAQTVLAVAQGEDEAAWVERAARLTVRELDAAVRRAGVSPGEEDEPWLRLRAGLDAEEREAVDEALSIAAELLPGSSRVEQLEAVAQELAGACPADPDADHLRAFPATLRPVGASAAAAERRARALEAETERWAALAEVGDVPVPEVRFEPSASAHEIDALLRELASLRAGWDDLVGYCALAVKRGGLHRLLGFASFEQYCDERLGLAVRAIEQRAAVEARRWASPALRAAEEAGLPFEKLRLLARLPEEDIAAWAKRAEGLTCIALRRELEAAAEAQLRAHRRLSIPLPRSVAEVVAAAVQGIRDVVGPLPVGTCLALAALHFAETWGTFLQGPRTRSQKARARDDGYCQVPGCSRPAAHAHHVLYRSHGGGEDPENLIGLCAFHHLRCVHGGWLRVVGRAPDGLRWFLGGEPWDGPRAAARPARGGATP